MIGNDDLKYVSTGTCREHGRWTAAASTPKINDADVNVIAFIKATFGEFFFSLSLANYSA